MLIIQFQVSLFCFLSRPLHASTLTHSGLVIQVYVYTGIHLQKGGDVLYLISNPFKPWLDSIQMKIQNYINDISGVSRIRIKAFDSLW